MSEGTLFGKNQPLKAKRSRDWMTNVCLVMLIFAFFTVQPGVRKGFRFFNFLISQLLEHSGPVTGRLDVFQILKVWISKLVNSKFEPCEIRLMAHFWNFFANINWTFDKLSLWGSGGFSGQRRRLYRICRFSNLFKQIFFWNFHWNFPLKFSVWKRSFVNWVKLRTQSTAVL